MEIKLAKAVKGRLVRNPADMAPITEQGTLVRVDSFILRRVKDGDITLHDAPKEKPKSNPKPDEGGNK